MKKYPPTFRPYVPRPYFGNFEQPNMPKAPEKLRAHFPLLGVTTALENAQNITHDVEHPHRGHVIDILA